MKNLELVISEDRFSTFRDEFKKFVKMSEKMNLLVPSFTVTSKEKRTVRFLDSKTGMFGESSSYLIDVLVISINIAETLKFNGWSLFATVHHREDIVDLVDIESELPSKYGCSFSVCEHCGHSHNNRVRSFVVLNEDNEFKQVGSTCIDQFLGINPNQLYKLNAQLVVVLNDSFVDEWDEKEISGGFSGGRDWLLKRKVYDIKDVFAVSLDILKSNSFEYVKKEGYYDEDYRRYVRTNEGKATVELVEKIFDSENPEFKLNKSNFKQVMSFLRDMIPVEPAYGGEESFEQKVKDLQDSTKIRRMDFWRVIWAILLEKRASEASKKSNEFVGIVGEKSVVECTIIDFKTGEGMFGEWQLFIMEDRDGNSINKFGTVGSQFIVSQPNDNSYIGATIKCSAAIKSHDEKSGRKTTMLGRLSKVKK